MTEPANARKPRRLGLQGYLGLCVAIFMLAAGVTSAVIGYDAMRKESAARIRDKIDDLTNIIKSEIVQSVRQPLQPTLSAMAHGVLPRCKNLAERLEFLPLLTSLLDNYSILSGVFAGYADGEYFLVRRLAVDEEKRLYNGPPQSVYMVSSIERGGGKMVHERMYYDGNLRLLARHLVDSPASLDPRERAWFKAAMSTDGQIDVSPYLTATRLPVMIFAEKSHNGQAVLGLDVALRQISEILRRELPTPRSRVALLRPDGTLIASASGASTGKGDALRLRSAADLSPILRLAVEAYRNGQRGRDIILNDGEQDWQVALEEFDFGGQIRKVMALAVPKSDLSAGGMKFLNYVFFGMGGMLILCVPGIWYAARRIARPLHSLAAKAETMHSFVLDGPGPMQSEVSEIQSLAGSMRLLQGNIRKMLTITQAISSERDFGALLRRVLEETLSVVKADGGAVALLDDEKRIILDQGAACWIIDGKKKRKRLQVNRPIRICP